MLTLYLAGDGDLMKCLAAASLPYDEIILHLSLKAAQSFAHDEYLEKMKSKAKSD